MLRLIIILSFIFLAGCGQLSQEESPFEMKRRSVNDYYISSGAVRYFLPEIPYWANFSEVGSCHRETSIKYLDFEKVRQSLALSYEEAIHLQLMFNTMLSNRKVETKASHIPFKEEEQIFFKASERIQAGIRTFRLPKFKKINLVWIDYLINKNQRKRLRTLVNSDQFMSGHPVFVSLCKTREGLEQWMKESGLSNKNIRMVTYEMLSPYRLDNKLDTRYHLYLKEIFKKKKVNLFYPKEVKLPMLFEGKYKQTKF